MRKSNVIENAFASSLRLDELEGSGRGGEEEERAAQERAAEKARLEAEWSAKMNRAFERGLAQGEAHAAEKLAPLMKALQQARAQLVGMCEGLEAEAQRQIVALATKLAEVVIRTQVAFDESVLKASLDEALKRTVPSSVVRIRVSPRDLAAAEKLGAELGADGLVVEGDASIGPGGCAIETQLGEIFSTIEHRWEAAAQLLQDSVIGEDENA